MGTQHLQQDRFCKEGDYGSTGGAGGVGQGGKCMADGTKGAQGSCGAMANLGHRVDARASNKPDTGSG